MEARQVFREAADTKVAANKRERLSPGPRKRSDRVATKTERAYAVTPFSQCYPKSKHPQRQRQVTEVTYLVSLREVNYLRYLKGKAAL